MDVVKGKFGLLLDDKGIIWKQISEEIDIDCPEDMFVEVLHCKSENSYDYIKLSREESEEVHFLNKLWHQKTNTPHHA
jgi:hypothetical protein